MKKGRHFKDNSKLTNGMSGKAKVTQIGLFSTVIIGGLLLTGVQGIQASEADGKWEPRSIEQIKKDVEGKSEYTIVWGDTLSGISQATNLTMEKLASLNGIGDYNLIYAGNKMIFEGDVVTVQDQNGLVKDQQKIQESDKIVPNQPAGEPVDQANSNSAAASDTNATGTADNGQASGAEGGAIQTPVTPEQPVQPAPTQPETPTNPENPTTPEQPTNPTEPEQPVEPQIKYTVWYTPDPDCDQSFAIVRGTKLFNTDAEATAFIDGYSDQVLMQGITGSYGVMSWEV